MIFQMDSWNQQVNHSQNITKIHTCYFSAKTGNNSDACARKCTRKDNSGKVVEQILGGGGGGNSTKKYNFPDRGYDWDCNTSVSSLLISKKNSNRFLRANFFHNNFHELKIIMNLNFQNMCKTHSRFQTDVSFTVILYIFWESMYEIRGKFFLNASYYEMGKIIFK